MENEGCIQANASYVGQYNPSSYAYGAFYADEQDTFVAGTSPPSSPMEERDDNGLGIGKLDFTAVVEESNSDSTLLDELNAGRRNIYDILSQRDAYDVLPDSQKLLVFNTNIPLDLVFQSLRRQEAVEGVIWNANTGMYEGVITSSDLLICLNRQYSLYCQALQEAQRTGASIDSVQFPRILDYSIQQYRDTIYPNQLTLTYGIPNNSLFQILKTMFDCHVHRIPVIDRINEGNLIGVVNYLNILHYLVSFYPEHLYNYDFSIQELKVGSYDEVWNVREDAPLYEVLRIMENQVISSVPVVDSDRNLIGIFQRTDLIKLDFHDMSVFNYPISTFISSFQPFSTQLIVNADETLSHLFFMFAQRNTTSLVCVDEKHKPCGIVSIVDLFLFFLKGDFSMTPKLSAPPTARERPSFSQSFISAPFGSRMSGSGSMNDLSVGEYCMNLPETAIQPRLSNVNRAELDVDTYDEEFEKMKGHMKKENEYRQRNDLEEEVGDRFIAKKMMIE